MHSQFLDKAIFLKSKGYSYQDIRKQLHNSGLKEGEINMILNDLDNEEIIYTYRKEKILKARIQLVAGLIVFSILLMIDVYMYIIYGDFDYLSLIICLAFILPLYFIYRRTMAKNHTYLHIWMDQKKRIIDRY